MMTGTSELWRISLPRSRPSPSGSMTSSSIRSGVSRSRKARALVTVATTVVTKPSLSRLSASGSEIATSSSTRRIRGFIAEMVSPRSLLDAPDLSFLT
jgi:hypothetical protein